MHRRDVSCPLHCLASIQLTAAVTQTPTCWLSSQTTHRWPVLWNRTRQPTEVVSRSWLSGATVTSWNSTSPRRRNIIVDFRAAPIDTEPITNKGQSVEMVSTYGYLGTVIDNKQSWTNHIDACCKKTQKKMYLLRKLQFFKVDQVTIQLFYQAIIENAIFFNLVYFFSSANKGDTRGLDMITRTAVSIISVHRTYSTICSQETLRYSGGHFPSTPRRCSVLHNGKR